MKTPKRRIKDTALIVVGDVKAAQFNSKKGKLTKLVYNAGWFELKRQLTYQCKNVLYVNVRTFFAAWLDHLVEEIPKR